LIISIIKTLSYYYNLLKLLKDYENGTELERCICFYILIFLLLKN